MIISRARQRPEAMWPVLDHMIALLRAIPIIPEGTEAGGARE